MVRELLIVIAAGFASLPLAHAQEAKKEQPRISITSLLKKGYEIRAVLGQTSDLIGEPGVVLQRAASVFVCREARAQPSTEACKELFCSFDIGSDKPRQPKQSSCTEIKVD